MFRSSKPSRLHCLATKWCLELRLFVQLARQIVLARKMGAQSGVHQADLVEAALLSAAVELSADIVRETGGTQSFSKRDQFALDFMKVAHALILAMVMFVRLMKSHMVGPAAQLAALDVRAPWQGKIFLRPAFWSADFIDTS